MRWWYSWSPSFKQFEARKNEHIDSLAEDRNWWQEKYRTLNKKLEEEEMSDWCHGFWVGTKEKPNELFMITRRDSRLCYKKEFETLEEAVKVARELAAKEPTVEFIVLAPTVRVKADIPVVVEDWK